MEAEEKFYPKDQMYGFADVIAAHPPCPAQFQYARDFIELVDAHELLCQEERRELRRLMEGVLAHEGAYLATH